MRGALEHSLDGVYAMQEDWSRRAFGETFLAMLRAYGVLEAPKIHQAKPVYAAADRSRTRILLGAAPENEIKGFAVANPHVRSH